MIEYNSAIAELKERLPEYNIHKEFLDNPTIVYSVFPDFITDAYKSKNNEVVDKSILLINDLAENDDDSITALIDEVAIGLFDESKAIYEDFIERLSSKAKTKFEKTIQMWSRQTIETDSRVRVTTSQAFYGEEDDPGPPPPRLKSTFKTIDEWLVSVCNKNKPDKSIAYYDFGLFESQEDNVIYLAGKNNYTKGDILSSVIEFEPSNMYYLLPKEEFGNMSRDELLKKIMSELKDFTNTKEFRTSFLAESEKIIFSNNGQIVWSKV